MSSLYKRLLIKSHSHYKDYITIAKDFGIINGVGNGQFKPLDKAKREEAAAMMMRMYDKLNRPISELHAFYAIQSYPQVDKLPDLDSVSFGWSCLEYEPVTRQVALNTTRKNEIGFYIPPGFTAPVNLAKEHNVSTQLMVYADNETLICPEDDGEIPFVEYILSKPEIRGQIIASIVQQVNHMTSDGQTISFDVWQEILLQTKK
ncbi:MAG: S-layer homology domain-containing protein [Ruminiclostridium sp.]|nr:S-layer homology domain-containing protein [Ruminiclostridium sp.]